MVDLGYTSTPITVTLVDGSTRDALLYHSLVDAWDLENKYDSQKRQQVASRPVMSGSTTVVSKSGSVANVSDDGSVQVQSAVVTTSQTTVPTAPVVTKVSARDAWANMFNSQPSLFPRK